ncbi:hypothetical protein L9F63_008108 [Diploptera punctata]|uniref:Uncharacterized protein n=1 Tax=Diploptera punctata TaxID=6984 RepID=A0AAD8E2D6_DIPPU|nr:hypothetical protein L9F63_008108 [Diploptera punctata]
MNGSNISEESDETINQYLQEQGLLEEGMNADDKRSLWKTIKLSKDTAQEEEQKRQKQAGKNLQSDEVLFVQITFHVECSQTCQYFT